MTPVVFFLVGALGNERRLKTGESKCGCSHVSGTIHTPGGSPAGRSRRGRYGRRSLRAVTRWASQKDPSWGGFWETVHHDCRHVWSFDNVVIESIRELKAIVWSCYVVSDFFLLLCLRVVVMWGVALHWNTLAIKKCAGHHKVLAHDKYIQRTVSVPSTLKLPKVSALGRFDWLWSPKEATYSIQVFII